MHDHDVIRDATEKGNSMKISEHRLNIIIWVIENVWLFNQQNYSIEHSVLTKSMAELEYQGFREIIKCYEFSQSNIGLNILNTEKYNLWVRDNAFLNLVTTIPVHSRQSTEAFRFICHISSLIDRT